MRIEIARHPSNEGSVLSFDMHGEAIRLFVADARYRKGSLKWGAGAVDVGMRCTVLPAKNLFGNLESLEQLNIQGLDLDAILYGFMYDASAKVNTDMITKVEGTSAAQYCRSVKIEDLGRLDLPTLFETVMLYVCADMIDNLDQSLVDQDTLKLALGSANPQGRFMICGTDRVWSSTVYNFAHAWALTSFGHISGVDKSYYGAVIPVKEL